MTRWITICSLALFLLGRAAFAETIAEGPFTVDFHPDDRKAAENGLRYLVEARQEFAPNLPLGDEPVTMRVAHTVEELRELSGHYGHVGVTGIARADLSAIAVKSPRLRSIGEDYRGTVRHELLHILLHRNTDTDKLPRWLNEGICMMLSNEVRWQSTIQLTRMHLTGQTIPIENLDHAFRMPGSDHEFGNAYAQALAMTRHLYDTLGEEKFWAVVHAMNETSFDSAMVHVGGLPVPQFWQDFNRGLWGISLITSLRTGSFWGVVAVACILAFFARMVRNRRIIRRWEAEEQEDAPEAFDWDRILEDADAWKRGAGGGS